MSGQPAPETRALADDRAASEIELFSVAGQDGYVRQVNEAFATLVGRSVADLEGTSLLELVHPDDLTCVVAAIGALTSGAPEVLLETRFSQRDGWVHLQWVARPMPGTDLWWACGRDTTTFHRLLARQTALRAGLELAAGPAAAMWELDAALGTKDVRSARLTWEPQARDIFSGEHGVPTSLAALTAAVHPDDAAAVVHAFSALAASGTLDVAVRVGDPEAPLQSPVRHLAIRGRVLDRDRRGRVRRAVGIVLDVSAEKALEDQMLRMVMHDALTGVSNRRSFDQALRGECRRATRSLEPLSVLMVDLDDFKSFNDTFGHLVGDDALCSLARALGAVIHREGDLLARYGGEEFAVVLPGSDVEGALAVAERLAQAARSVVLRQADGRSLTVSIGTATWSPDGTPLKPGALLARADQALYAAKAQGKDRAVAYEGSVATRDALQADLARALADGEFVLWYQPVLDLAKNVVVGFEALVRWVRPGYGLVPPNEFIPVMEDSDLICDLGRWALHEAAAQLRAWDGVLPSGPALSVAVNASARHVNSAAIVADVEAALAATGLSPSRLEVELTETALTDAGAGVHLAALRALGVSVAIDDFGTGYTSIGQLPQLPIDTLKIDRSFVASENPRQQALVTLMVGAAAAFDLGVVAEGIEDEATLDLMRSLGCHRAQGYFIARPMPATDVPAWLDTQVGQTGPSPSRGVGSAPVSRSPARTSRST